jgi:hypothetical protein
MLVGVPSYIAPMHYNRRSWPSAQDVGERSGLILTLKTTSLINGPEQTHHQLIFPQIVSLRAGSGLAGPIDLGGSGRAERLGSDQAELRIRVYLSLH